MFRILLILSLILFIIGGLIFANWKILKLIPRFIIISIISAIISLIILIFIVKITDNARYDKGGYKPAHFENGVLVENEIIKP